MTLRSAKLACTGMRRSAMPGPGAIQMRGRSRRDRRRGQARSHLALNSRAAPGYDRRRRRCRPGIDRLVAAAMRRPLPQGAQAGVRLLSSNLQSNWQREQTDRHNPGQRRAPGGARFVQRSMHRQPPLERLRATWPAVGRSPRRLYRGMIRPRPSAGVTRSRSRRRRRRSGLRAPARRSGASRAG